MGNVPKTLTKHFARHKYDMSTGSDEWRSIKCDYEILDDAVAGGIAHGDRGSVDIGRIRSDKLKLQEFKLRVDGYSPHDESEAREKEILADKISVGLEIYSTILR